MAIEGTNQSSQVRDAMRQAQERKEQKDRREDSHRDEARSRRDDAADDAGARRDEGRRHRENSVNFASLSQIGRLNPTPIAMTNTAEALEQFRRDLVEAMPSKEDNNMLRCQVYPVDASSAGLPFSLVIVAGSKVGREEIGVAYHTFMLAASAEPLRPTDESYRGHRVTVVQVPGDAYDNKCREVIKEVLGRAYPGKNLFSADAEVIDANFPSAKDDEQAIADCVKNAFASIKTAIDRHDPDAPRLRLSEEDNENTTNQIHVQHRQNHIFDRGHMPIRADMIIDLQSRPSRRRNSRDSIDQLVTGTRISRVGGFFDVVYAPAEGALVGNDFHRRPGGRLTGEEYQLYALRFITTFADTIDFGPTTLALAVATVNAISDPREIIRAFEPNPTLGEDDMRNVGALAIEPNLQDMDRGFGERHETKSQSFTNAKLNSLLRTVLRPGMIFSFDVPECGAATWQWIDWMAAAQGDTKAMNRIYDAICTLTDGHFEDLYRRGDPIIDSHVERIHAGYYTEGDRGIRLDIRDLDYLAVLNMLRPEKEDDLQVIQRWGMATASKEDTILSQSDRYEIIRDFVPTAVITGFHQRYNLEVDFNEALLEALMRCKLSLEPTSHGRDGADRYRTTYGNIDQILTRSNSSGGLYRNQRRRRDRDDDRFSERSERFSERW